MRLSLVHYHFGGRQRLLSRCSSARTTQLLERQRELFAAPGPLAEKWRIACDLLDEDIRSGYVRVLWELWAAGLATTTLPPAGARHGAAGATCSSPCSPNGPTSSGVELPLRPRALATLIANVFQGIEIELLAGVREEAPHREVLDALGR